MTYLVCIYFASRLSLIFAKGAVNLKLTDEEVNQLEESYKPQAVFGHT